MLRDGFSSFAHGVQASHPVQAMEIQVSQPTLWCLVGLLDHRNSSVDTQNQKTSFEGKMATVEKMFGTALTLHLRTEKAILSKYQRLPGLPSSRTGLETILGEDEEIGFADVLSGKCHTDTVG